MSCRHCGKSRVTFTNTETITKMFVIIIGEEPDEFEKLMVKKEEK